jgi:AcrR family transcriptional regulator
MAKSAPRAAPRAAPDATVRPRKAPSQPRAEKTVAIILEAAALVLEAEGLEGFNTNAVARRAGVSIGSLYQYFPGKDALTLALMRRERQGFRAELVVALDLPAGPRALAAFVGATVRQQLRRPVLARLLDVEETRPVFRDADAGAQALTSMLRDLLTRPDMPALTRPEVAAGDLAALVQGMTDAAGERGETDIPDLEHRVRAAVFGYLDRMANDPA